MMDPDEMQNRFSYHPPVGVKTEKHQTLRQDFQSLAEDLDVMLPESREKALAFTNLEQALMWANAAIARRS